MQRHKGFTKIELQNLGKDELELLAQIRNYAYPVRSTAKQQNTDSLGGGE